MRHKPHTEIEYQHEGHHEKENLGGVFLGGYPSEEGAEGDEFYGEDADGQVAEELAVLVGFEHRVALLAQLGVLA